MGVCISCGAGGLAPVLSLGETPLANALIAESALTREESRGSHFRVDFPSESEAFERHVVLRPGREPALEAWQ